jgi:hypothetical protein
LLNNQSVLVGQNAYASFGTIDPKNYWIDVVGLWKEEKKNFKFGVGALTGFFLAIK